MERYPEWTGRYREECLADVLRVAINSLSNLSREVVINRVHARLQTAKQIPLDDWDYDIAIRDERGLESNENIRRQQEFVRLIRRAYDPNTGEEVRAQAEAEMGRRFGFCTTEPIEDCHK